MKNVDDGDDTLNANWKFLTLNDYSFEMNA